MHALDDTSQLHPRGEYIELLTDISLSMRARLVHPWPLRAPTWEPPLFIILAGPFQRVLVLFGTLGHFSFSIPFLLFRFVCVRVLRARHRGRARHRRG